jgi:5-oxoprolinase (ATP-hydrolysing)
LPEHLYVPRQSPCILRRTDRLSPKIFGPNEDEGLDIEASKSLFDQLANQINAGKSDKLSVEEVAAGFIRVANETMCRPIRT